jgi:hypothetical protein
MVKEFVNENNIHPTDNVWFGKRFLGSFEDRDQPKKLYWTPRALAILKGSTNRAVNSEFWTADICSSALNSVLNQNCGVIITDLRYCSELVALKQAFGDSLKTVRINRFDVNPSSDPSENDLNSSVFDINIENKGSREEFISKIQSIFGAPKDRQLFAQILTH